MYRAIVLARFGLFLGIRAGDIWHRYHSYTHPTWFPHAMAIAPELGNARADSRIVNAGRNLNQNRRLNSGP